MGDNKILKLGALAVATAATAAGSVFLADKSLKSLIKGMLGSEVTKLRKPVKDDEILSFEQESVVRDQLDETQEEILPRINLDDVASVIDNAAFSNDLPTIEAAPPVEPASIDITPMEPTPTTIDITPIEATPIEITSIEGEPIPIDITQLETAIQTQPLISNELPIIETKPLEVEPEVEITLGLPYLAGKLENLEYNEGAKPVKQIKIEEAVKQEPEIIIDPIAEIEPKKAQEVTVEKQEKSSNPFLDMSLIQQDAFSIDETVKVTRPSTDEPIVAIPPEEEVAVVEDIPIIVSGPYLDETKDQLPPEPVLSQVEPEIEITKQDINPTIEREFGEPILSRAVEYGKTKVIGTNIVSDEPYNKAIEMVALQFPDIQRDRLVSIMSNDGAGIVFEFSSNRARNENTLVNVFSITPNGKIMLPTAQERSGALEFGKAFITDKPELNEFFTR